MKSKDIVKAIQTYPLTFEKGIEDGSSYRGPSPINHPADTTPEEREALDLAYQAGSCIGQAWCEELDVDYTYEVIQVNTTWTVLQYEERGEWGGISKVCKGGDWHWLTEQAAQEACRAYQTGVANHGDTESVIATKIGGLPV